MEQQNKLDRLLWIGMLGAISTMIGDFLLLGVSSAVAEGALGQYLMAAEKISYTRIGLAGFFGFVGIPLTFKILLNAVAKLGTSAFLNGIGCSNMSLGSLIIFIVWMVQLRKVKNA